MDETITREWLHAHSTPGGGWTAEQLAVFDIPWPPRRGWLSNLVGRTMTSDQKRRFEEAYAARQAFRRAWKLTTRQSQAAAPTALPSFEVTVTIKPK